MNGPVEYPELPPEKRALLDRILPWRRHAAGAARQQRTEAAWRALQIDRLIEIERLIPTSDPTSVRDLPVFIAPNGRGTYGSWLKYHFNRWFGMPTRGSQFRLLLLMLAIIDFVVIVFFRDIRIVRQGDYGTESDSILGLLVILNLLFLVVMPTIGFVVWRDTMKQFYGSVEAADEHNAQLLRSLQVAIERGGDEGRVSIRAHYLASRTHSKAIYRRVRLESLAVGAISAAALWFAARVVTEPIPRLVLFFLSILLYRYVRRFLFRRIDTLTGGVPLLAPRAHPHPHDDVVDRSSAQHEDDDPEAPSGR